MTTKVRKTDQEPKATSRNSDMHPETQTGVKRQTKSHKAANIKWPYRQMKANIPPNIKQGPKDQTNKKINKRSIKTQYPVTGEQIRQTIRMPKNESTLTKNR